MKITQKTTEYLKDEYKKRHDVRYYMTLYIESYIGRKNYSKQELDELEYFLFNHRMLKGRKPWYQSRDLFIGFMEDYEKATESDIHICTLCGKCLYKDNSYSIKNVTDYILFRYAYASEVGRAFVINKRG